MTNRARRALIVVAHPDDEVLAFGGSSRALRRAGWEVFSAVLCGNAEARAGRPDLEDLHADMRRAHDLIGVTPHAVGDVPNLEFNTLPLVELVRFVESSLSELEPDLVVTHHPGDLNDDHLWTARACVTAARLPQRRGRSPGGLTVLHAEVLSSTEWGTGNGHPPFRADTYLQVTEDDVEAKIDALAAYRGVTRPVPHPRSPEAIRAQATLRGVEAGYRFAEAFSTSIRRIPLADSA